MAGEAAGELGELSCTYARMQDCEDTANHACLTCHSHLLSLVIHLAFSSQELNLSYQDLGDPFQQENFLRILRRLIRVEKLQLVDNSLTDLSSVRLPRCKSPLCLTPVTSAFNTAKVYQSGELLPSSRQVQSAKPAA